MYVLFRIMSQSRPLPFRSLRSLRPLQAYRIEKVDETLKGILTLYLKASQEEGTFRAVFLFPYGAKQLLKETVAKNNSRNGSDSPYI